jgi:glycosyltransferase involved in cell wall biosynthesis
MRILIVSGIYPPDCGGPASYVPYIAKGMVEKGINIEGILTLSDQLIFYEDPDFSVKRIARQSPRFIRMIKTIYFIHKMSRRADVVYLNGLVLEGIIACKLLSRKSVIIKVVGDLVWEKFRNHPTNNLPLSIEEFQHVKLSFYWACLRKLQSSYTRLADGVIVPSNFLRKIVQLWGIKSQNIHLIFNAVNLIKDYSNKSSLIKYDVVTVARLVPWKGVWELMITCHELGVSLLVVGDGPMRKELETKAKEINIKATFVGNVPQDRVASYIRKAKLFVLNSSYEGLPHIILEAKLTKTPVLATNAGGSSEIISHKVDGWLILVGDLNSLKDGISQILENPSLRERLALNGYKQVINSFSSEIQIHKTINALKSIYNKRNNKSVAKP